MFSKLRNFSKIEGGRVIIIMSAEETTVPPLVKKPKEGMMILDRIHAKSCFSVMPSCVRTINTIKIQPAKRNINKSMNSHYNDRIEQKDSIQKASIEEECQQNNKRTRVKITREQKIILDSWLRSHHFFPYPTQDEKKWLSQRTGLNIANINTWFTNKRRRERSPSLMTISKLQVEFPIQNIHLSKNELAFLHRSMVEMDVT